MSSGPVCVDCRVRMRCHRNSVFWLEHQEVISGNGTGHIPYKLYQGDMWKCRVCKMEVLVGFGRAIPRHDPQFDKLLALVREKDAQDGFHIEEDYVLDTAIRKGHYD